MENLERRRRRSNDPLVALHYQLTQARAQGSFDTLVVADDSGVVVAGSGAWVACEELAALAPLLLSGGEGTRLDALRTETMVLRLASNVLLCGRGTQHDAARHALEQAGEGVSRILAA